MAFNPPPVGQGSPYQLHQSLLTRTETRFYEVLQQAVPNDLQINMKVRLADLVSAVPGLGDTQGHQNRIQQKHVDFVLTRRDNASPVLVIELDDPTHQRLERQERDAFLDNVMHSVGLPILHVPTQATYNPGVLAAQIQDVIRGVGVQPPIGLPIPCPARRPRQRRSRASREIMQLYLSCIAIYGFLLGFLPGMAQGGLGLLLLAGALLGFGLTLWLDRNEGRNLLHSALFLLVSGALMFGVTYGIMWYFISYLPNTGLPLVRLAPLPTQTPLP